MGGIAGFIMRGRWQAVAFAAGMMALPMMYWLGAAAVALVWLRFGSREGISTLMWSSLPALAWAATGQPSALICLLTTAMMAAWLRRSVSWTQTLLLVIPASAVSAGVILGLMPQAVDMLVSMVQQFVATQLKHFGNNGVNPDQLAPVLRYVVIGVLGWFNLLLSVMALILARRWQAALYNPGGFQSELHQLRLSAGMAGALLLTMMLGTSFWTPLAVLLPALSIPLLIAGIGLVHGTVGLRGLSHHWLIVFYLLLMFMTQVMYPLIVLLACLDSLIDFRGRMRKRLQG